MKSLLILMVLLIAFSAQAKYKCRIVSTTSEPKILEVIGYVSPEWSERYVLASIGRDKNKRILRALDTETLKLTTQEVIDLKLDYSYDVQQTTDYTMTITGRSLYEKEVPNSHNFFVWVYNFNPTKLRFELSLKQDLGNPLYVKTVIGQKSKKIYALYNGNEGFSIYRVISGQDLLKLASGGPSGNNTNPHVETDYRFELNESETEFQVHGHSNWVPNEGVFIVTMNKDGQSESVRQVSGPLTLPLFPSHLKAQFSV